MLLVNKKFNCIDLSIENQDNYNIKMRTCNGQNCTKNENRGTFDDLWYSILPKHKFQSQFKSI